MDSKSNIALKRSQSQDNLADQLPIKPGDSRVKNQGKDSGVTQLLFANQNEELKEGDIKAAGDSK